MIQQVTATTETASENTLRQRRRARQVTHALMHSVKQKNKQVAITYTCAAPQHKKREQILSNTPDETQNSARFTVQVSYTRVTSQKPVARRTEKCHKIARPGQYRQSTYFQYELPARCACARTTQRGQEKPEPRTIITNRTHTRVSQDVNNTYHSPRIVSPICTNDTQTHRLHPNQLIIPPQENTENSQHDATVHCYRHAMLL